MKLCLICLYLIVSLGNVSALTLPKTPERVVYETELKQQSEAKKRKQNFAEIKYYLLNGETRLARREMQKLDTEQTYAYAVKQRYMAILYFIEGDYELSLKTLEDNIFKDDRYFAKICVLKTINRIITSKMNSVIEDFERCKIVNYAYITSVDWLETIIRLKNKDERLLKGTSIKQNIASTGDLDSLKIWLKLALYLGKEEMVMDLIADFPQYAFDNPEVRELVGLIYYREKKFKSSLSFVEDLTSPNAENVKGNIYLEKKAYELALAQFKLALQKKQNSFNALERAISLAWILGLWGDGEELSNRLVLNKKNEANRLTLQAAFMTNQAKYDQAAKNLELAQAFYIKDPPRELAELYAYVSLQREDKEQTKKYYSIACQAEDGLACYMSLMNQIWEDLPKTAKREDNLGINHDLSLNDLKQKAEISPLKEAKRVDQKDIEELDEQNISLVSPK